MNEDPVDNPYFRSNFAPNLQNIKDQAENERLEEGLEQRLVDLEKLNEKYEKQKQQVKMLIKYKQRYENIKKELERVTEESAIKDEKLLEMTREYTKKTNELQACKKKNKILKTKNQACLSNITKLTINYNKKEEEVNTLTKYRVQYMVLKESSLKLKEELQKKKKKDQKNAAAAAAAVDNLCVICYEQPRTSVLVPCSHQICCFECSQELQRCPICNSSCTSIRVFCS